MNINADPEFVGGSDYHLQTTSPAIDAGTDANAPVNDIDNDQRASSNHFSLGIADKGFYPLDIGFDELVPARDRR